MLKRSKGQSFLLTHLGIWGESHGHFDLDYVGHEMKFGAYHTYSFETEGTALTLNLSGSTIMAYAG